MVFLTFHHFRFVGFVALLVLLVTRKLFLSEIPSGCGCHHMIFSESVWTCVLTPFIKRSLPHSSLLLPAGGERGIIKPNELWGFTAPGQTRRGPVAHSENSAVISENAGSSLQCLTYPLRGAWPGAKIFLVEHWDLLYPSVSSLPCLLFAHFSLQVECLLFPSRPDNCCPSLNSVQVLQMSGTSSAELPAWCFSQRVTHSDTLGGQLGRFCYWAKKVR